MKLRKIWALKSILHLRRSSELKKIMPSLEVQSTQIQTL